jgi:UDP-glucuronate 4-epimerase
MAVYGFTHAIAQGRPINVYNRGESLRDFTYVDDVVEAVIRVSDRPACPNPE